MAKKAAPVVVETYTYRVVNPKVGKMLGPYVVQGEGGNRTVTLTARQAKFYLDQGTIEAV